VRTNKYEKSHRNDDEHNKSMVVILAVVPLPLHLRWAFKQGGALQAIENSEGSHRLIHFSELFVSKRIGISNSSGSETRVIDSLFKQQLNSANRFLTVRKRYNVKEYNWRARKPPAVCDRRIGFADGPNRRLSVISEENCHIFQRLVNSDN
jgi:hypothetical protein